MWPFIALTARTEGLKSDVPAFAGLELRDDRLRHTQFLCEVLGDNPLAFPQGDEPLFNTHRLKFRLDGGGELRVVLRAPARSSLRCCW